MSGKVVDSKQNLLTDLGFQEPFDVHGRSSIADLISPSQRCGIYILHFTDGDCYVGQAKDVTRRYTQHRNTFFDIQRISFKTIPSNKLDHEEIMYIEILEKEGFLLRNIEYTSIFRGESDFDKIMTSDNQEKWLTDLTFVDSLGPRPDLQELYRKTERAYQRFEKHPEVKQIVRLLHTYIPIAIPAFKRTEADYWSMTSPNRRDPVRINLQWQEVFAVKILSGQSYAIFQLAKSPLDRRSRKERMRFRFRHRSARRFSHRYRPGGQDQTRFEVPLDHALRFIREPNVTTAIRLFNLRLMRKGMTNYRRNHCVMLADQLIG